MSRLGTILEAVRRGELDLPEAERQIRAGQYADLGHSRVDHDRLERNGASEVIYGQGKTVAQIQEITESLLTGGQNVLVTRVSGAKARRLLTVFPDAEHNPMARTVVLQPVPPVPADGLITIVSAGTSDQRVAEEAKVTAEFYGNRVRSIHDAGVAGIHRLLAELDDLRQARVVIAVAGMEGALPSVVAGLVKAPVIAVPTSVGYGASFGGAAALLAMLNSCASGLSVVNIDNGFGAGYLASVINHL
ncbi:MAG: nickel pincer cofactor biosynthesis protein LarB [Kiritimatiellae bacterium]|nr:nickel pincer cofactor biosynthesis protein LarB [Kiritimatiellia bacterium]